MITVALVFAPLAPLVSLAGAIVFWISSWVYKYQLMFVYITRVETGGVGIEVIHRKLPADSTLYQRLWNLIVNRLLVSVILMQMLMILSGSEFYSFNSFFTEHA